MSTLDLVLCLFSEAGVKAVFYHPFASIFVVTDRRSAAFNLKNLSSLPASKRRRFMLEHLLLNTLY